MEYIITIGYFLGFVGFWVYLILTAYYLWIRPRILKKLKLTLSEFNVAIYLVMFTTLIFLTGCSITFMVMAISSSAPQDINFMVGICFFGFFIGGLSFVYHNFTNGMKRANLVELDVKRDG